MGALSNITVGEIAAALAAVTALGTAITVGVRKVRPVVKKLGDFLEDWNGQEARAGHPRQPGVMERLASVEHELKPNSGRSLRDQTNRIEASVGQLREAQQEIHARTESIKVDLDKHLDAGA